MRITAVTTRVFRIPLRQAVASATLTLTHRELILVTLEAEGKAIGTGWATTPGVGALAARALIDNYLLPLLIGQDARHHERIWQRLWTHCHFAGSGGLTTLALAPIDVALWDAKARAAGEPLHRLLGGSRSDVPVYASAINIHLTEDELLEQVEGHLRQGYAAFKLKVGRANAEEDLHRCRAVRALIGPDRELLLDANQKWTPAEAVQRCRMLAETRPGFIEEPSLSDDVGGHALIRAQGGIPVALGERLGNRFEFWNYVRAEAVDILQPCPWKVGGITEWLRIASLGACANRPVSPHGALELTAHLAAALPNCTAVENIFGFGLEEIGATTVPLPVRDGRMTLTDTPGHGVIFDGPALHEYEVR